MIIVQGIWCVDTNVEGTKAWFGAAEQSINAIFVICPTPEKATRATVKSIERLIFGFGNESPVTSCHSLRLSRFLFVVRIISGGLIGLFTLIFIRIVANEAGKFSSEILMRTSTLALCKFICVSRSFCEKCLPLVLLGTLSKSPISDITIRANTVITLDDLTFR